MSTFGLTVMVWMFLSIMGLDGWTLGINVAIPAVYTSVLALTPPASKSLIFNYLGLFIMICLISVFVAVAIERTRRLAMLAEALLVRELQASQMADSVLNHTLKNILADVAGNVELYLADVVGRTALEDALTWLTRGMKSCKQRNVYLKLVAGEYRPIMNIIHLRDFGQQLIAGRNITASFVDLTVNLDCTLLALVMENGISNAIKHGHMEAPNVCLAIQEVPTTPPLPGHRRLCFSVSNEADPRRPTLTPDVVEKLFQGQAELQHGTVAPQLSERIGLTHCALAARAGGFALSLRQEGRRVVFSVEVDVEVIEGQHEDPERVAVGVRVEDCSDDSEPFPAGLVFAILDDSAASQRLVEYHLRKWCSPTDILKFGAAETDVEEFVRRAVEQADIVILDQHLEYSSASVLGTDVVARLRQRQYRGLVCIRSAADTPEDRLQYIDSGAHCTLGKDVRGQVMVEELKTAYLRFRGWTGSALSLLPEEPDPPLAGVRSSSRLQLPQSGEWAEMFPMVPPSPNNPIAPMHLRTLAGRSPRHRDAGHEPGHPAALPGHVAGARPAVPATLSPCSSCTALRPGREVSAVADPLLPPRSAARRSPPLPWRRQPSTVA
eukprot:EG_transcript_1911